MNDKRFFIVIAVLIACSSSVFAQTLGLEKERHKSMLSSIKNDLKKNYYDPTIKGVDVEAKFKLTTEKIEKATSIGQMSGIIAQFLIDLDDSHLYFMPPPKANKTDYGFDFRMVGDKCLIVQVDKDSDAEKQGISIGDEIWALNDFAPGRDNLWKMRYYFFSLRPQPAVKLDIISPDGQKRQLTVQSKIVQGRRVKDLTGNDLNDYLRESESNYKKRTTQYVNEIPGQVFIWKMPAFSIDPEKVDSIMSKARKFPSVIFDLRANGGGRVDMVLRLIGNVFEQDIKVADEKRRKDTKEIVAKGRGKDAFKGQIVVLIDSASGSASEVFSRVLQIEKRGTVIGDRSAGAVMESRLFSYQTGMDVVVFYGASITVADLIMKDGKSLEKIGVTPDVVAIPNAKDVAARRDVAMSKALETLGLKMTPEVAGTMFPADEDEN